MRPTLSFLPFTFVLALCIPVSVAAQSRGHNRPVYSESFTVGNLHPVDSGVYRSAQPDAHGFGQLEYLGTGEVLNLRNLHSDTRKARHTGLTLHQVKMRASRPEWNSAVEALKIIRDRRGDIVIHCWHGSDRTGLVVALYRIAFQDWTKEAAIDELVHGGYGYHKTFEEIPEFIRGIDVEKLKEALSE